MIRPREALFSGPAGRTLVALAAGTAVVPLGLLALPPLLPAIVREFSIPPSLAGVGLTVMWASAAFAMFPGGRLSDVTGRVTALVAAVALATVGFLALALAPEFLPFVLAMVVCGVAVGIYEPSAFALVSELFVSRRGQALGVITSSYNAGSALAGAVAAVALAAGAWRLAFLPVVAAFCVVGLLTHRVRIDPYRIRRPSLDLRSTGRRLLGTTWMRLLLGLFCLYTFVWQGTISFLPLFLRAEAGFTPRGSTAVYTGVFVVGLLVSPVAGGLGDRFGHRRVGAVAPLLGTLGLSATLLGSDDAVVRTGLFVFAVGLVGFWPVMTASLMDSLSRERLGGDYGFSRAVFFGVGSLGPTYVGIAAQRLSYAAAYGGLVGCFLLSAVAIRALGRFE